MINSPDDTSNKKITVNLSYYNQPKKTLIRHLDNWKKFKKEIRDQFSFVVIDDCSKIPAKKLLNDYDFEDLDFHLYQVEEDLYCNIAGVRNLGATECVTPYLIILDMDTVIDSNMAESLIKLADENINKKNVFKFNRKVPGNSNHIKHNKMHPAICLIRKEDYWRVGGCEEDLVGHYGETDPCFWYRANGIVNEILCRNINLLYYPDAEADINRDIKHNSKIFAQKKLYNNWSIDFIRFKWKKII